MERSRNNRAWWLVLPSLLLLGFVGVWPLVMVVNYSFYDIFMLDAKVWVGLKWYAEILTSDRFWQCFGRSLFFSAVVLMIEIPLGIAVALSLPKKGPWVVVCLVSMSLPLLVPWNMIAMIWHLFLSPSFLGKLFTVVGIDFDLALNAWHTWAAIICMDVWHWTSLVVLLCYSGLATIPEAYYRTAAIDGASRWNLFRYIELPKLRSVLMMAVLLRFIDSFMVYVEPFRLNAGGPRSTTTFLAMELGQDVVAQDYGPASARAVIYFIIVVIVSGAFKTAFTRHESHNKFG